MSPLLKMPRPSWPHAHAPRADCETPCRTGMPPVPATAAVSPLSGTRHRFMEDVLCARHCARRRGYRDEQDTVPAHEELTVYRGRQTQKQTITKQRGTRMWLYTGSEQRRRNRGGNDRSCPGGRHRHATPELSFDNTEQEARGQEQNARVGEEARAMEW